jgi:hypothetical protein
MSLQLQTKRSAKSPEVNIFFNNCWVQYFWNKWWFYFFGRNVGTFLFERWYNFSKYLSNVFFKKSDNILFLVGFRGRRKGRRLMGWNGLEI